MFTNLKHHITQRRSALGAINRSALGGARLGAKPQFSILFDRETGDPVKRLGQYLKYTTRTLQGYALSDVYASAYDGKNIVLTTNYYPNPAMMFQFAPEGMPQDPNTATVLVFDKYFELIHVFSVSSFSKHAGVGVREGKIYLAKSSPWGFSTYELDGTLISDTKTKKAVIWIKNDNDGGDVWICCLDAIYRNGEATSPLFSLQYNNAALVTETGAYHHGFSGGDYSSKLAKFEIYRDIIALTEIKKLDIGDNHEYMKIREHGGKLYISNGRVYDAETMERLDDYAPLADLPSTRNCFEMDSDGNVYILEPGYAALYAGLKKYDISGNLIFDAKYRFLATDFRMTICGDYILASGSAPRI